MTVIYADMIFLVNTLVDYLVILMAGRLAGVPLQRKRFLAAALWGGLYAVAAAVPELCLMRTIPVKLLVWWCLTWVAYGYSEYFLKETILLGLVSCILAGVVLALGLLLRSSLPIVFLPKVCRWLLLGGILLCFLCAFLFRSCAQSKVKGTTFPVLLSIAGRKVRLTALLDTGNQLRDSETGQPILIVSPCALKKILSDPWSNVLTPDLLQNPVALSEWVNADLQELSPKLVPYRTLGVSSGMLLTLRAEWMKIQSTTYPHASIAIAPCELGFGYSALWGGRWKGASSKHDSFEQTLSMAEKATE